jgi:tetratricopeptide (TPR) repeat protein
MGDVPPSHASLDDALARAEALLADRPATARRQAEAILDAVPNHPQALLILGAAHRDLGDAAAAATVLRPLARTQLRAAAVHHEWALTQAALGDPAGAIASLRHALALKPSLAQAWRALGDLHMLAGEPAVADAAYAEHIRHSVHDPALLEAASALCDNDLPAAERLLRAHLRRHPTDVAALRMLAEAGIRLGRYADAEAMLAHCLELAPSFTPARHNTTIVLFRQNRPAEALPHLRKLLTDTPNDAHLRSMLAASLAMTGDTDGAIAAYEQVLAAAPAQPKLWLSYGHALKTAGRRADAVHAYRKTLDLAPALGEAWWSLANLKTESFFPADIATMQSQLTAATSTEDSLHLHYALGRALEQAQNYPASFTHYAEGARLRRSEIRYNADRTHTQLDRTRALLTQAFFAARAGWGCEDPAPIFIVGLPRSGSTLIEQILASHSLVEGTMELPELARIARALGGGAENDRYPDVLADLDAQACAALGERFLNNTRIYRKSGKPFFIDKMPNNFVHAGLIHLILPRAKIIDARRHPMAAGFSAFKQHFARGQHYSYDFIELGRYINDYAALMAHFDSALPGRVHRVQYETMVTDTEAEVRRLLAYCGLEYEEACLRFHENGRAVRTASSEQVRRPIFTEGVEHWRHYEAWLEKLKEALLF